MSDIKANGEKSPTIVNDIQIDDTFAEAFGMSATGVIITADTPKWAMIAAKTMSGFGTSVIGCGAECGIDDEVPASDTPDGRPGVRVLLFGFSPDALLPQLKNRVGQCVLTSPGSACYNGVEADERLKLSTGIRFFGDGFQTAKKVGDRRFWRVPVMDGEFVCEDTTGVVTDAVGGGNLLIIGRERAGLLETTEAAVDAIAKVPDVIAPFPGGIVRSGSKVGAKYAGMMASTNNAFCPTLKAFPGSELSDDTIAVLEIVIDGLTSKAVSAAMKAGLKTVLGSGAQRGVTRVSAGNYGGKLGQHHYHLKEHLP
ncbi:MAG: formylmethanofuran--tetrahydromethanopterin N-formyltransferase [Alphaproteobacteria bacterium]|nr:formylmethanofuran--tetrahydromethanopterin N-formyltransferase [Alphaproteobacteria bacterium]